MDFRAIGSYLWLPVSRIVLNNWLLPKSDPAHDQSVEFHKVLPLGI